MSFGEKPEKEQVRPQTIPVVETQPGGPKRRIPISFGVGVLSCSLLFAGALWIWRSPDLAASITATTEAETAAATKTSIAAPAAAPVIWEDGWLVEMHTRQTALNDVSEIVVGSYRDANAEFRWTDAGSKIIPMENPVLPAGTMRSGSFEFTENVAHVFRVSVIPSAAQLRQVCAFRLTVDGQEIMKADGIKLEQGVGDEVRLLSPTLRSAEPAKTKLQLWHSCIKVTEDGNADSSELDNLLGSRERLNGKARDAAPADLLGAGLRIEVSRDGGAFTPLDGTEVSWPQSEPPSKIPGTASYTVTPLDYGQDWTEVMKASGAPERHTGPLDYGVDDTMPATPVRIATSLHSNESGKHIIALAFARENGAESIVSCHVSGRLDGQSINKDTVETGNDGHGIWLHQAEIEAGSHSLELDVSCKPRGHRSLLLRKEKTPGTDGVTILLMGRLPSEGALAVREHGMFRVDEAPTETMPAQTIAGDEK